ncbi:MAG: amidohydrolase [Chloroflexota bacterium]|nr:amidohydrolase [Chloroflexota bacterium]
MSVTNLDELRAIVIRSIDESNEGLIAAAKSVYEIPETGFNERKTSSFVQKRLEELNLSVETGIAITGLKAVIKGNNSGPTIAVIAELDALRVPSHPGSDSNTGAAHACGHHIQIGALLGVATALVTPVVKHSLSGNVVLILTPAEEFIEIEDRLARRNNDEIEFLSGKQEMIRLGAFDGIDMAMMIHASNSDGKGYFSIGGTTNAHVTHQVRYMGKSAHAGGAPHKGINALQAAMLANAAINTQRETFVENDVARVHGIISNGGTSVNAVPDEVLYEGRVRAGSIDALRLLEKKVIRCYKAGALAMGASVEIQSVAGYHPLTQNASMEKVFVENANHIFGQHSVISEPNDRNHGGSTDMGDLSKIMPVIHPYSKAASGIGHGEDYIIQDYNRAVVASAKVIAATVLALLHDDAIKAKETIRKFTPYFTPSQYVKSQRDRFTTTTYRPE